MAVQLCVECTDVLVAKYSAEPTDKPHKGEAPLAHSCEFCGGDCYGITPGAQHSRLRREQSQSLVEESSAEVVFRCEPGILRIVAGFLEPEDLVRFVLLSTWTRDTLLGHDLNLSNYKRRFLVTDLIRFFSESSCRQWRLRGVRLRCTESDTLSRFLKLSHSRHVLSLTLSDIHSSSSIIHVGACVSLRRISLSHCPNLVDISPLGQCKKLKWVDLSYSENVTSIAPLASCKDLRGLYISGCRRVNDLHVVDGCTELEELDLDLCVSPQREWLPRTFRKLRWMSLRGCSELKLLPVGFSCCEKLESVNLASCESLVSLQHISKAQRMKSLTLSSCESLLDISALYGFESLTSLDLSYCVKLKGFGVLASCPNLTELDVSGSVELVRLPQLRMLRRLKAVGCPKLESIEALAGSTLLLEANFMGCRALTDISPVGQCPALSALRLALCTRIQSLREIERCQSLSFLDVRWTNPVLKRASCRLSQALTVLA